MSHNLRHSTHTQNSDRKSRSRSHNLRHSTHTQNSERKSKSRSHNLRHITLKIPIGKPQPMIHKCEIQLTTPTGKNKNTIPHKCQTQVTFALSVEIHVAKHNCRIQMNISDSTYACSRHNERNSREAYSMVVS